MLRERPSDGRELARRNILEGGLGKERGLVSKMFSEPFLTELEDVHVEEIGVDAIDNASTAFTLDSIVKGQIEITLTQVLLIALHYKLGLVLEKIAGPEPQQLDIYCFTSLALRAGPWEEKENSPSRIR